MRIWIDLDNSPHVHFFAPIVSSLRNRGMDVIITARSYAQTVELARWYGLDFATVGRHRKPGYVITRALATCERACQLGSYVHQFCPTAAVSHGSRAQALAAWIMRVPVMTLFDYEFTSHRFFCRISQRILVPSEIPAERLLKQGLDHGKFVRYPGLKEEVYVYEFRPDPGILSQLGLDRDRLIVTVRPPATWAHYHDPLSDQLFAALVERLRQEESAQVIIIPRTSEQAATLRGRHRIEGKPFWVMAGAIDALSLMWYSDAVFCGGGTMGREAALLGRTTYSIFGGKLGAADLALVRQGKLTAIRDPRQLARLPLSKCAATHTLPRAVSRTRDFILNEIIGFADTAGKDLHPTSIEAT